jgi:hypothetical protein
MGEEKRTGELKLTAPEVDRLTHASNLPDRPDGKTCLSMDASTTVEADLLIDRIRHTFIRHKARRYLSRSTSIF